MAAERGFVRRSEQVGGSLITPRMLNERKMGRYVHDRFRCRPLAQAIGGGAATGTSGDINQLNTGNPQGVLYEYMILGTETIVVPALLATGLNFGLDDSADEGIQFVFGAPADGTARARLGYTIGTDPAFFMKGTFIFSDASGTDEFYFGFRKQQAMNATFTTYTDYACFAILTKATAALIQTATDNDDAGETAVSTTQTWADAATKTFEIQVSSAGVVKFLLNNAPPTVTQAFTFDAADLVVPCLHMLRSADAGGSDTFVISDLEVGFLPE
jgi:hypothetical protein